MDMFTYLELKFGQLGYESQGILWIFIRNKCGQSQRQINGRNPIYPYEKKRRIKKMKNTKEVQKIEIHKV